MNIIKLVSYWIASQFSRRHNAPVSMTVRQGTRDVILAHVGTPDSPATREQLDYIEHRILEGLGISADSAEYRSREPIHQLIQQLRYLGVTVEQARLRIDDVARVWHNYMGPTKLPPSQKTIEWEERWHK